MTIKDIDNREDLDLITDSDAVDETLQSLGHSPEEYGGLFIAVEDGEITELYAFEGNIPYLWKRLDKLI
jgi:hypothetical protein